MGEAATLREVDGQEHEATPATSSASNMRRPSVLSRPAGDGGAGSPLVFLLALVLTGSGGAGIASAVGGPSSAEFEGLRRDVESNETKVDAASEKVIKVESTVLRDVNNTQRWLGDNLIKQSAALRAVASRLGLQVDVSVEPLLPPEAK